MGVVAPFAPALTFLFSVIVGFVDREELKYPVKYGLLLCLPS